MLTTLSHARSTRVSVHIPDSTPIASPRTLHTAALRSVAVGLYITTRHVLAQPVWICHRRECPAITYMAMGFRPRSFPVGGMYVKGVGRLTKVKKITRFSFPLLLKRKKYFTNPSCLPHWQRKTSPRSTALVTAESVCNHSSAHAGIPHWSRAPPPPSKLTLAFDRRFGNTRDRFLNEQNHLSYQKLHIRKRLVLLILLKNR